MTAENPYKTNPEAYARFAETSFAWKNIERPALDRNISPETYAHRPWIVDLGSGSGRIVNYHVSRGANPARIFGFEESDEMLPIALHRFPQTSWVQGPMQEMCFRENSLDLVTANMSLRYLDDRDLLETFRRVREALKPGGAFVFVDAHPDRIALTNKRSNISKEGKRLTALPWGGTEEYYYRTIKKYEQAVINAGLKIVKVDNCPIALRGAIENPKEYVSYAASLSRFAISAIKS